MKKPVTAKSPLTSPTSKTKAPVSERKASANRANAQHSTGPRTARGKAASSLNALRHGILSQAAFNVTIEGEERRAEFDALVAGLAQEFQPRTMVESMTVQQLAGCYWRLAKVWTFETEAAWRSSIGGGMPLEEMKEYEDFEDVNMEMMIGTVTRTQKRFFPKAGLGYPTIPGGAAARTLLRYQGSLTTMMTRCLTILERRRKEHLASDEAFEEHDYISEAPAPVAEAPAPAPAKAPPAKPAHAAADASLHKRTQEPPTDAEVAAHEEGQDGLETVALAPDAAANRPATP